MANKDDNFTEHRKGKTNHFDFQLITVSFLEEIPWILDMDVTYITFYVQFYLLTKSTSFLRHFQKL